MAGHRKVYASQSQLEIKLKRYAYGRIKSRLKLEKVGRD
jgi:hypothetical protein